MQLLPQPAMLFAEKKVPNKTKGYEMHICGILQTIKKSRACMLENAGNIKVRKKEKKKKKNGD